MAASLRCGVRLVCDATMLVRSVMGHISGIGMIWPRCGGVIVVRHHHHECEQRSIEFTKTIARFSKRSGRRVKACDAVGPTQQRPTQQQGKTHGTQGLSEDGLRCRRRCRDARRDRAGGAARAACAEQGYAGVSEQRCASGCHHGDEVDHSSPSSVGIMAIGVGIIIATGTVGIGTAVTGAIITGAAGD